MITKIKYTKRTKHTDYLEVEINPNQLALENEYKKHIFEDEILKKTESYKNGKLTGGKIYLRSSEDLEDIITQYNNSYEDWAFCYDYEVSRDFKYSETVTYLKGTLKFKFREVANNKLIAYQSLDIVTNDVLRTLKYYYDEIYGDEDVSYQLIKVTYGSGGEVENINSFLDPDEVYKLLDYLEQEDLMAVFNWNEHPYYHKAEPLIPNGDL
jgi:hypothetical protein